MNVVSLTLLRTQRSGDGPNRRIGRDCGSHRSCEARERYRRLVREWRAAKDGHISVIFRIVDDCMANFVGYYRKNGKLTSEMRSIRFALEAWRHTTRSLLWTVTW